MNIQSSDYGDLWLQAQQDMQLSDEQVVLFKKYTKLMLEWRQRINLTAFDNEYDIVTYHYYDALQVKNAVNLRDVTTLTDVGTGAGIPGLPLKIKYPHLKLILLEVNLKKVAFLREVIRELSLEDIEIRTEDWRTFLRTTSYSIDLFCARASLAVEELLRALKKGCRYHNAQIAYWASKDWKAQPGELIYVRKDVPYKVGDKQRRIIVLKNI